MTPMFEMATQNDLADIVRIYNQTIASRLVTADLEPVAVEERVEWFQQHNPNHRPLWLIVVEGKTVGWISLSDFYGRIAYQKTVEVSIYIDKDYHGHHLGTAALLYVENQVNRLEIDTVLAFIFRHNHPSITLFKKFGYEVWGHLPKVAELDGVKRDLEILGKRYS